MNRTFALQFFREKGSPTTLESKMRIQPQMWYRLYLTISDKVSLYVNGFLEIQGKVKADALIRHLAVAPINNDQYSWLLTVVRLSAR